MRIRNALELKEFSRHLGIFGVNHTPTMHVMLPVHIVSLRTGLILLALESCCIEMVSFEFRVELRLSVINSCVRALKLGPGSLITSCLNI